MLLVVATNVCSTGKEAGSVVNDRFPFFRSPVVGTVSSRPTALPSFLDAVSRFTIYVRTRVLLHRTRQERRGFLWHGPRSLAIPQGNKYSLKLVETMKKLTNRPYAHVGRGFHHAMPSSIAPARGGCELLRFVYNSLCGCLAYTVVFTCKALSLGIWVPLDDV